MNVDTIVSEAILNQIKWCRESAISDPRDLAALQTVYNYYNCRQDWIGEFDEAGVVNPPASDKAVADYLRKLYDNPATGQTEPFIKQALQIVHDYLCLPKQRIL